MSNATSVVVDTHAFIWYLRDDPDLSPTAGKVLDAATAAGNPIVVSAVTLVELRYLVEKSTLGQADFAALTDALAPADSPFTVAPIDQAVALRVGSIPRKAVRDPWDRMIAATALTLELPLVTRDGKLQALKALNSVW